MTTKVFVASTGRAFRAEIGPSKVIEDSVAILRRWERTFLEEI